MIRLIGGGIAAMMKPETTAVLVESPGSQSMEVQDIPAIAAAAHAHGACVIADNTWATPLFFPPHERGCDLAVEAGTKYLAGHADLLMGLVSANSEWAKRLRATFNAFSMGSSPDDAALALARAAHHGATAARTGARRARHRAVAGGPTGSFARAASRPCRRIPATRCGNETLPAPLAFFRLSSKRLQKRRSPLLSTDWNCSVSDSHGAAMKALSCPSTALPTGRRRAGMPEGPALRFSIGLEDVADLKSDLEAGLRSAQRLAERRVAVYSRFSHSYRETMGLKRRSRWWPFPGLLPMWPSAVF